MYKTRLLWALVTVILYVAYFHLYKSNHRRSTPLLSGFTLGNFLPDRFTNTADKKLRIEKLFFMKYWDLQRRMRFDYNRLIEPCKNNMKWQPLYAERTPYTMTSIKYSNVSLHINPFGQYSRLTIETFSLMNTRKNIGGDSWRVFVKGESSVPVTMLDNIDGTYEASFLLLEPGEYRIELYLEYTLCDGMKDPPNGFFAKGMDLKDINMIVYKCIAHAIKI